LSCSGTAPLSKLLREGLASDARTLLVANFCADLVRKEEALRTLRCAQKVLTAQGPLPSLESVSDFEDDKPQVAPCSVQSQEQTLANLMERMQAMNARKGIVQSTGGPERQRTEGPPSKASSKGLELMERSTSGTAGDELMPAHSWVRRATEPTVPTMGRGGSRFQALMEKNRSVLQKFQAATAEKEERDRAAATRLQEQVKEMEERLHSSEDEQARKIEEARKELEREMAQTRSQSRETLDSLAQVVAQELEKKSSADEAHNQKLAEETSTRIAEVEEEVRQCVLAKRKLDAEVVELRERLASAEEKARILRDQEEEFVKVKAETSTLRASMCQKEEEQRLALSTAELERERCRAEVEVQGEELRRVQVLYAQEAEAYREERDQRAAKETELMQQATALRREVEQAKHAAKVQSLCVVMESDEASVSLRLQVQRLEAEASTGIAELESLEAQTARIEAEHQAARPRWQALREEEVRALSEVKAGVAARLKHEAEILSLLDELQDSILKMQSAEDLEFDELDEIAETGGGGDRELAP